MSEPIWRATIGDGPIVATAIHDGHEVRDEVRNQLALDDLERLREEDPHTGTWTKGVSTRVIGTRSRFEVDLNRPREKAVYRTPEDAWGLKVWKDELPDDVAARSLAEYDAFYAAIGDLYANLAGKFGIFVVFDLHTYNHRRAGPEGPLADPEGNPQVNIGTGTMKNRGKFARLIERFQSDLSNYAFPGGNLDVRENIKFFGGNHARWTHEKFPDSACVLAIEFKKFFMDEWTGKPNGLQVEAIGKALASTVPGVMEEVERIQISASK